MKRILISFLVALSLTACGGNGVSINVKKDSSGRNTGLHMDVSRDTIKNKLDTLNRRLDTLGTKLEHKVKQVWDSTKSKTTTLKKKI